VNILIEPPSELRPGQRALRPAQDLDSLEVEQVEHRPDQLRVVDVVNVDADAGLVGRIEVGLADAADRGGDRGAERGALRLEDHVRRAVRHLREVGLALGLHHLGGHRGDRQRGVLQVLLAELRGDEDHVLAVLARRIGVRRVVAGRLVLRSRGHRDCEGRERRRNAEKCARTSTPGGNRHRTSP
jgi:hypothetical protein